VRLRDVAGPDGGGQTVERLVAAAADGLRSLWRMWQAHSVCRRRRIRDRFRIEQPNGVRLPLPIGDID
jgi:hypothetical protein